MYGKGNGNDPMGPKFDFSLWNIKGSWVSKEGSPRIRIYRNTKYKNGGYYLELAYDERTVYRRPIKSYWSNIRYFDLYGFVGLAYDPERDVLQLSAYGDYYRAEN